MCDQSQNFQTDAAVTFTANYTGLALADFLLGRENTLSEGSPNAGSPRTIEFAGYVQDDWKATKRLTLNAGLCAGIPSYRLAMPSIIWRNSGREYSRPCIRRLRSDTFFPAMPASPAPPCSRD